jgi:tRNA threonylcarbamoyladenosine biosynthesis protein TsaB
MRAILAVRHPRPSGLESCAFRRRISALKILALDTSTEHCSAAVWIDGELDVREANAGQRHSALLLGMIDALLKARHLNVRDLDGIAFGEGPGSFTGLRIACGVVQGLAFGADVPVVGIGTLLAMAEGSGAQRVVTCVDARVQEIYHGAYERRGPVWHVVHPPSLCAPAAAPELPGEGWLGCGSGFVAYRALLEQHYAGKLAKIDAGLHPHARDIATLAAPLFEAGRGVSADEAAPVYLRDKVALRIDERANR